MAVLTKALALGLSLGLAFQWLMACDPYDPDLGDTPFQCGVSEPRCPDGYECVEVSTTETYCLRQGDDSDGGLGPPGPFVCADDSSAEPNDITALATPTPIPATETYYQLAGLAICPTADVDLFEFAVTQAGTAVRVDIQFIAARAALVLDLINAAGGQVASSALVDGNPGHLRVTIESAQPALYYVRVQAATEGLQNNYELTIETTPP